MLTALALLCLNLFEEKRKAPVAPKETETRIRKELKKAEEKKQPPAKIAEVDRTKDRDSVTAPDIKERVRIAILIDDIGQDMAVLHDLLDIDVPLSFAVLPHQPHSTQAAQAIHRRHRETLLHLPMEPQSYPKDRPGEGALFLSMNDEEIRKQFQKNLASVPHALGVNNHMGSRFSEDEEKMAVVMTEMKDRGLFFVDSRTTSHSKAKEAADRTGVPFLARKIFIDNDQSYKASLQILTDLLREPATINGNGPVLLIGHPYPSTVAALRDAVPLLEAKGVKIVPVSKIVRH